MTIRTLTPPRHLPLAYPTNPPTQPHEPTNPRTHQRTNPPTLTELRAWGLEDHAFCIAADDEGGGRGGEGVEGDERGMLGKPRRLHIGRTTTAGTLEAGNSNTEWTVGGFMGSWVHGFVGSAQRGFIRPPSLWPNQNTVL